MHVVRYARWLGSARLPASRRPVAAVLLTAFISITTGLTLKPWPVNESRSVSLLSYSDLKPFFESRGIAPGFVGFPLPAGMFAWATARPAWSPGPYLVVWAAALFAIGGPANMYPAIFDAPLVFEALFAPPANVLKTALSFPSSLFGHQTMPNVSIWPEDSVRHAE